MKRTNIITQEAVEIKNNGNTLFAHIISKTATTQRPKQKVLEDVLSTFNHLMGTMPWYNAEQTMYIRKMASKMNMSEKEVFSQVRYLLANWPGFGWRKSGSVTSKINGR